MGLEFHTVDVLNKFHDRCVQFYKYQENWLTHFGTTGTYQMFGVAVQLSDWHADEMHKCLLEMYTCILNFK